MVTDKENTRWIEVWAVNDPEHYGTLQAAAEEGPDALRAEVERIYKNAPPESQAWYQAKEMSDSDYGRVDWQEVADSLLG